MFLWVVSNSFCSGSQIPGRSVIDTRIDISTIDKSGILSRFSVASMGSLRDECWKSASVVDGLPLQKLTCCIVIKFKRLMKNKIRS